LRFSSFELNIPGLAPLIDLLERGNEVEVECRIDGVVDGRISG
jgi:hypothetical protein